MLSHSQIKHIYIYILKKYIFFLHGLLLLMASWMLSLYHHAFRLIQLCLSLLYTLVDCISYMHEDDLDGL